MTDHDQVAANFEEHRAHLRGVAYRMLGSTAAADDAVQEAWLRLARTDRAAVANLRAWLTTVVSRICLDALRSRSSRDEDFTEVSMYEATGRPLSPDPADDVELVDSVGAALLIVLDQLSPAERLTFVLHDVFALPFDEIGAILDRSPAAAKQMASRARNKVRGSTATTNPDADVVARQRQVVDAFLRAARDGDLTGLVAVLDPDVVVDADAAAARMGAPVSTRGADDVAAMFSGRALGAEVALVDDSPGLAWIVDGTVKVAWNFYVDGNRVVHIDMHADRARIDALAISPAGES